MGEKPLQPKGAKKRTRIDWNQLRQRLEAARTGVSREMTVEETKKILRARGEALARPPLREAAGENLEILEFLLAYETYGLEMVWVRETCPLKDLTPLPGTPPFVAGIVNVRGKIVSVLDIRRLFDLPAKGLTDLNKVIIVHNDEMEFGILVDAVVGTRAISLAGIQPSLPTMTGIREEYLKGVTSERLVLLDGAKLLSDRRLIVHEEVRA